jgi:prophage antirepressor-like protein
MMIGDKPYFPAGDCAKRLGYARPNDAIHQHCRSTVKHRIPHPQSPEKQIEVNFIPEGDLYRLIIRSKLPAAERFEKWVFDEVLPSIRKHGVYVTEELLCRIKEDSTYISDLIDRLIAEKAKTGALLGY